MKKSSKKNNYNVIDESELLYFSNPEIYEKTIDNNYNNSDNILDIDIFQYNNNNFIQTYCFENGSTALYKNVGNDKLAILYEKEFDKEGNELGNIYTSDTFYCALQKNNKFVRVISTNAKDFSTITKISRLSLYCSGLPLLNRITTYASDKYSQNHCNTIVYDSTLIDEPQNRALYKDFKSRYMTYERATNYIPAGSIINKIIQMLHHYIATNKIDEEALLVEYMKLMNFQEMCSSSISKLAPFIHDHNSTDLRTLCEQLQHNVHNIESFIDINLRDELEK